MVKSEATLTKVVGSVLVFLSLLCTAVVVAHSCHSEQAVTTSINAATPASQDLTSHSLITDICAGIFYLVLILGGKFLLRPLANRYRDRARQLKIGLLTYKSRVRNNLTLSLPELGICRI